jgi:hypothetical protein
MKKFKFKKNKEKLRKLVFKLAENFLLSTLVLISLAFLLGAFIFYKYSYLPEKKIPQITPKTLEFEEGLFQKIVEIWEFRQQKFDEVGSKEYPDLFQPSSLIEETLTE